MQQDFGYLTLCFDSSDTFVLCSNMFYDNTIVFQGSNISKYNLFGTLLWMSWELLSQKRLHPINTMSLLIKSIQYALDRFIESSLEELREWKVPFAEGTLCFP